MDELLSLDEAGKYGAEVQEKLWRLLRRQAKSYTLGDSGSLPQEVAEELFKSVLYTLKSFLADRGEDLRALAVQDENAVFDQAVKRLEEEIQATKALYRMVARNVPRLEHRALEDTLKNIGVGLERYDYRNMAHEVPCEIDYQICQPVPDKRLGVSLLGVSWVREYLRRLAIEGAFLSRLDGDECKRFLKGRFPDYRELLINMFEQVMPRALGRVMTGEDLDAPRLTGCTLSRLPRDRTRQGLRIDACALCEKLDLPLEFYLYVGDCADALWPRYAVAVKEGTLGNIF